MRQTDIREFLQAQPFRPFRLFVLETTAFEVLHPELVATTRSTLRLTASPGTTDEREVVIALVHITRMELISSPPPAPTGS